MKLYFEDDEGRHYEISKATELQQGDVIVFLKGIYEERELKRHQRYLSRKLNREVVVLNENYRDIVVIPPIRELVDEFFQTDSQP